jgi:hypothetical protein
VRPRLAWLHARVRSVFHVPKRRSRAGNDGSSRDAGGTSPATSGTMLGLSLLLAGARRTSRRGRAARSGAGAVPPRERRRPRGPRRPDRPRDTAARAYTVSQLGDGNASPPAGQAAPLRARPQGGQKRCPAGPPAWLAVLSPADTRGVPNVYRLGNTCSHRGHRACRPVHAQALNQLTGVAVILIRTGGAAGLLLPRRANAPPNGCAAGRGPC